MQSITLGHYLPGDSFLHNLDPRIKLLCLLVLIVTLFLVRTFWGFMFFGVFIILIFSASKLPWRYFLRGLRPVFFIIFFTLILHFLFTDGGRVYLRLGPLTVEEAGVFMGTFMTLRLVLLVITTLLITLTTSPISLRTVLNIYCGPFRRLGIPGHEYYDDDDRVKIYPAHGEAIRFQHRWPRAILKRNIFAVRNLVPYWFLLSALFVVQMNWR